MRCTAKNHDQTPCGAYAIRGAAVCRMHGGAAPQVRKAARLRVIEAVDLVVGELLRLALHAENEGVRVRAISLIFDRAGFGEPQRIEITHITDEALDEEIRRLTAEMASFDE